MKNGFIAAVALAGFTAASGASAQIIDDEHTGWYAGAGIGEFAIEIDDFDDVDDTIDRYDTDDTAWRAFVGWRANQWLAIEGAYINLGSPDDEIFDDGTVSVETDGFAPYLVGTLPIGDWFEVFAKAGYYFYDIEVSLDDPFQDVTNDDSGSEFTWSAGVGLDIFDRFNVRLEYEQFDLETIDDSNALWLTGAFRF